jgi:thiol-disulfide isomerase/thioredoxin
MTRFVKFYSPFCHHCIDLAPIWKELAEKMSKEHPNLHLAEVDCLANGDLCNDNGINAFPALNWLPSSILC